MKRSKFSEEQVAYALRQVEAVRPATGPAARSSSRRAKDAELAL
jgi:hypothetical protein